jgi:DNA mismatch endonuclease (patch repair protein)
MMAVGKRDTAPEKALRSELHRRGLRFRVNSAPVPGRRRADVVFRQARLAVYVDGCFWHGCPVHGTRPKTNQRFWAAKIERNQKRDHETDMQLFSAGWLSVRVWEHESPAKAAERIATELKRRVDRQPTGRGRLTTQRADS